MREFSISEVWFLVQATRWTVLLAVVAFIGGGVVGLAIAILRVSTRRLPRATAIVYIKVLQGTPLLMQLYLVYFGSNLFGIRADAWLSAALGLTLYASAFLGEIWRGCIQAIPSAQWEGARALALSRWQQLLLVILPQAFRISIPPTVGFLVQVLKGTSLASIIGFTELTRAAQMVNNATFRPFIVYALVTVLYFALCWPLSLLSQHLERRLDRDRLPTVKVQA
ncbi:MAG: amino acid ABC transporter permease [Proteobacteria bacterium]|nr:amino acid ABC transporter permease [Pseudomonadota bacterium]